MVLVVVLGVHFLLLLDFNSFNEKLLVKLNELPGFFYKKSFFWGEGYVVYFQSTLLLSVFSIFLYLNGRKLGWWLLCMSLALSTSRFGVLVSIVVPILLSLIGVKNISKMMKDIFLPSGMLLLFSYYIAYLFLRDGFSGDAIVGMGSFEARVAHLISTIESIDVYNFMLGQGPGSFFYTLRIDGYVDNSELTYLEFFRKFGLVGYWLFLYCISVVLNQNYKHSNHECNVYLLVIFFVALSNPVLTSIIFSFFVALSLRLNSKEVYFERSRYNCSL